MLGSVFYVSGNDRKLDNIVEDIDKHLREHAHNRLSSTKYFIKFGFYFNFIPELISTTKKSKLIQTNFILKFII